MEIPETRYALSDGLHIAYQVYGDGPVDIVHVSNWTWCVDLCWDLPIIAGWLNALGQIGRVVMFDMPGTGSSDPLPGDRPTNMEDWMDTVGVVLDAVNVERAALIAHDVGGMMSMLFAAAHPERVAALVLIGSTARMNAAPGYDIGFPAELQQRGIDWWLRMWGTGKQIQLTAPSMAVDEDLLRLQARWERLAMPPATAKLLFTLVGELDVRGVLGSIRVPTLVIHRRGDRWIRVAHGRYLADNIPDARYVEVAGDDHFPFVGDMPLIAREIRTFLGATRPEKREDADRMLATVLFTDIVSSTERAAELGDRRWKELLDSHDRMVREALSQFKGREIKTTGDGFLAAFDGPGKGINCAIAIRQGAHRLGIDIRAGLHVGEVELRGEDIGGLAVHAAARILASAEAGQIVASSTVKDLVIGAGFDFDDRGVQDLKGIPGEWRLYAVRQS
ncbi:MAG: adenylate/guanylate cyclase domain-containing protein [Actinomycetota bacterium]